MPPLHILAHRLGGDLVVADRPHHPPPGRAQRHLRKPQDDKQHDGEKRAIGELDIKRRGRDRIEAKSHRALDKGRIGLQVHLVGHRARHAGHVLDPAREPVLVLHHRDHDLGDAERRDGQIIRPEPQSRLADHPGRPRREQPAHRPADQHRKPETAEIAGRGRAHRLDRRHRRVKDRAVEEKAREKHPRHGQRARPPRAHPPPEQDRRHHRRRPGDKAEQNPHPARGPGLGHRRHRDQHCGEPAERDKAHDAHVEQPREPPLQVHAQRHDRRDQPHVDDRERKVPPLHEPRRHDQRGHRREQKPVALGLAHTDCPLKIPVGRNSSTMIRIAKLTANL